MPYGRGHGGEYEVTSISLPITAPTFQIENTTSIMGIKQTLTAGNQFTGVAPSTTPVLSGNLYASATSATGGLFDPENVSKVLKLVSVELDLADQSSWKLEFVDQASNAFTLYSGTTEASYFVAEAEIINLLPGETLKLTTVGASLAMNATLKFRNARAI